MEIYLSHGITEIWEIYRKFVNYCLPNEKKNIVFCENKWRKNGKYATKYILKLTYDTNEIYYLFDPQKRRFSIDKVVEKDMSK